MGHSISGFIGLTGKLRLGVEPMLGAVVCPLGDGFAFVPLTRDLAPPNDPTTSYEAFVALTVPLLRWVEGASVGTPMAYVETDYFGGTGEQAAAVWIDGRLVFGPTRTGDETERDGGAINQALKVLGVRRSRMHDEFAILGLGRYRDNDKWVSGGGSRR